MTVSTAASTADAAASTTFAIVSTTASTTVATVDGAGAGAGTGAETAGAGTCEDATTEAGTAVTGLVKVDQVKVGQVKTGAEARAGTTTGAGALRVDVLRAGAGGDTVATGCTVGTRRDASTCAAREAGRAPTGTPVRMIAEAWAGATVAGRLTATGPALTARAETVSRSPSNMFWKNWA
jgi:hypothetical protein